MNAEVNAKENKNRQPDIKNGKGGQEKQIRLSSYALEHVCAHDGYFWEFGGIWRGK